MTLIRVTCQAGHDEAIPCRAMTYYQLHPTAVHRSWRCPDCGLVNIKRQDPGCITRANWVIARGGLVVFDPAPDELADPVRTWTEPWTDAEVAEALAGFAKASPARLQREARDD